MTGEKPGYFNSTPKTLDHTVLDLQAIGVLPYPGR